MLSNLWRVYSVQARGVIELGTVEAITYEGAKMRGANQFAKKNNLRRTAIHVERIQQEWVPTRVA